VSGVGGGLPGSFWVKMTLDWMEMLVPLMVISPPPSPGLLAGMNSTTWGSSRARRCAA